MTVARDLMTTSPAFLPDTADLREAARVMASEDVGAVPVCSSDGRVVGVVTDRDIVVKAIAHDLDPAATAVTVLLEDNPSVVTVKADDDIHDVLEVMSTNQVRRVPVLEGDELVGMLSQADIARTLPDGEVGDLLDAISQE